MQTLHVLVTLSPHAVRCWSTHTWPLCRTVAHVSGTAVTAMVFICGVLTHFSLAAIWPAVHCCLFTPGQSENYHLKTFRSAHGHCHKKLLNLNESFTFQCTWSSPDPWLVHAVVWDLHSSCPVLCYFLLLVEQCDISSQGESIERQSRIAIFRPFKPLQVLYFNRILRRSLYENYKIILKWDVKLRKKHLLLVICVAVIPVSRWL